MLQACFPCSVTDISCKIGNSPRNSYTYMFIFPVNKNALLHTKRSYEVIFQQFDLNVSQIIILLETVGRLLIVTDVTGTTS